MNSDIKVKTFREEAKQKLFDICSCKCAFEACNCDKTRRVPSEEKDFLKDQRSMRLMYISSVDKVASKKLLLGCKEIKKLCIVILNMITLHLSLQIRIVQLLCLIIKIMMTVLVLMHLHFTMMVLILLVMITLVS